MNESMLEREQWETTADMIRESSVDLCDYCGEPAIYNDCGDCCCDDLECIRLFMERFRI